MGLFNDDHDIRSGNRGSKGIPGLPGQGFLLTSDNNYDMQNKKLVNVKEPTNDKDVVNKKHLDNQFSSVMMTRNVFKNGIVMEGGRIEALGIPINVSDATTKAYVDNKYSHSNSRENFEQYLKNSSEIGSWRGNLYRNGSSVNIGFDSSKAILFDFEFEIIRVIFSKTRIILQNQRVIFTPWYNVLTKKTYSITISLKKKYVKN